MQFIYKILNFSEIIVKANMLSIKSLIKIANIILLNLEKLCKFVLTKKQTINKDDNRKLNAFDLYLLNKYKQ